MSSDEGCARTDISGALIYVSAAEDEAVNVSILNADGDTLRIHLGLGNAENAGLAILKVTSPSRLRRAWLAFRGPDEN